MGVKKFFNRLFNRENTVDPVVNTEVSPDVDTEESKDSVVPNTISFGPGFALTQLPIISLYQGGSPFNFLLDTGSNDSIIDSNILDMIKHEMSDEKSTLFGMEGNSHEVMKCNITLSYEGTEYPYEYLIHDMKEPFSKIKSESGVILHGIIGSKFFNAYKYVLDFDELVAYSKMKR